MSGNPGAPEGAPCTATIKLDACIKDASNGGEPRLTERFQATKPGR